MAEIPPLRVREADSSPNLIPVFEMIFSGATLSKVGATGVQVLIDSGGTVTYAPTGGTYVTYAPDAGLTAERVLVAGTALAVASDATNFYVSLVTPVSVSSGGTSATTHTAFGVLYGSGASAIQSLAAMVSGSLVVGSGLTTRPFILPGGGAGQYLISTAGVVGNLAWVNTLGGSAAVTYAPTGGTYLTYAPDAGLTAEQILIAGTGVSVASDGTNFFTSVNTNIRDKGFVFFAAGTISTLMRAASAAVYIPFNMELRQVQVALGVSASNILTLRLVQYNRLLTASTSMMANANTIGVAGLLAIGSDTGAFNTGTLFAGSHLGYQVMSTGAATFGQDMTLTVICRTS